MALRKLLYEVTHNACAAICERVCRQLHPHLQKKAATVCKRLRNAGTVDCATPRLQPLLNNV